MRCEAVLRSGISRAYRPRLAGDAALGRREGSLRLAYGVSAAAEPRRKEVAGDGAEAPDQDCLLSLGFSQRSTSLARPLWIRSRVAAKTEASKTSMRLVGSILS